MMTLTRRTALLAPGLLALSACQPPSLLVEVSGSPRAIRFSARRGEGPFGLFSRPAPIGAAAVRRWPWPRAYAENIVWEIRANSCELDLTTLQYGVVPASFEQTTPAQSLAANDVYAVEIQGCAYTNSPGVAFFKISNDGVHNLSPEEEERLFNATP